MRKTLIIAVTGLLLCSSCKKYLDVIPDNVPTLEHAFKDRVSTQKYLTTCYSRIPRTGTLNEIGFMGGDDLWFHQDIDNKVQYAYSLALTGNNTQRPLFSNWHGIEAGLALWQAIRDCNTFIANAGNARDLDGFELKQWMAEVKTLKAFYHFYLMKQYGPIPILRENLPISADPDAVLVYREPVDDIVNYIVELLDEAIPDLPLNITNEVTEAGRLTKAAALAIKAQVLVTAASPLFNGNQDYVGMIDGRGVKLFNTTYDPGKWDKAAAACKNAIDTCHLAGIQLYEFNNPSVRISDSTKYVLLPGQIVTDKYNRERIWSLSSFVSADLELATIPRVHMDQENVVFQRLVPTLKMAEMYYSNNGVPINEDTKYKYNERYELAVTPQDHLYYMQPGYVTANLHLNREPRFYGSLAVDGGWWFGLGRLDDKQQWPLNFKLGSVTGGRIGFARYSVTTFYIKKLSNYYSSYSGKSFVGKRFDFPLIRLADLYLLYAEALNESLPAPSPDVLAYVDLVRVRAGLKGVAESWSQHSIYPGKFQSKEGMREIIHQERNIELAFEGHRFWDLRRWKKSIEYYNQPVMGWNTEGVAAQDFYQPVTFSRKPYGLKDVLWPIMQDEILRNTKLIQNPGW
jgi:hypothetical protein